MGNKKVTKCGCNWTCAQKGCPETKKILEKTCAQLSIDFKLKAGTDCTELSQLPGIKDPSGTFQPTDDKETEKGSATRNVTSTSQNATSGTNPDQVQENKKVTKSGVAEHKNRINKLETRITALEK